MAETRLTPEQQRVVDCWGRGLAVQAGAGSGKTTTLVIKCLELLKRKPDARFAAVSFTERSAGDLRAKLARSLPSLESHWVMTIHGLCATVLREFPREAGFDGEERMLSESEVRLYWERALESLWFDTLPAETEKALDRLLEQESRAAVAELLLRVRSLNGFGAQERLREAPEGSQEQALALLSEWVIRRYERLKRREGRLDFEDLEAGALRALESESIRRHYQQKFDLVMVDEFQDTNPVQAEIIKRFVKKDYSNLCVVGDPKQSIYRFRDADVTVFEEFCSRLPENLSLTWNFRSRPGIIRYVNEVCAPLFEASALRFEALDPKREAVDLKPVLRLEIRDPSDLVRFIKAELASGVPLSDMAVLVRKIRGNEKWFKALAAGGIPIAIGSGGLFWEDPRVREMVAGLKAWIQPGNTQAVATFLRAPWVGVPDEMLDQWFREARAKREPELVWKSFLAYDKHPLARMLQGLSARVLRPGEFLQALLLGEPEERELGAPLLGLWHRVEDLSNSGLSFERVVQELARAIAEGRRERDVPPPRSQGQLTIMTFHGSKGLEFPRVILVDFSGRKQRSTAPSLFWDRHRGLMLGKRDEEGARDRKHPDEQSWRALEEGKNLAESKRLFYVALTRAQEQLVLACLPLPEPRSEKKPAQESLPAEQDNWRLWIDRLPSSELFVLDAAQLPGTGFSTNQEPHNTAHTQRRREVVAPSLQRPRHSVTEWNKLSRCPRAYEWTLKRQAPEPSVAPTDVHAGENRPQGPSQREIGTRVHACLENGDWNGLRALEEETRGEFKSEAIISWAEESEWMKPSAEQRQVWSELPFEIPVEGEVLVGAIDRVMIEKLSDCWRVTVIDFKITRETKDPDTLLATYRTQLKLYAWALMRLLKTQPETPRLSLQAVLVNFSGAAAPQCVCVELPEAHELEAEVCALARQAAALVQGKISGEPRPDSLSGHLCRHCDFARECRG